VRNEPGCDRSITQAKGARCVTPGTLVAMARRAYGKNRDASSENMTDVLLQFIAKYVAKYGVAPKKKERRP